jgi:hypothetical protein
MKTLSSLPPSDAVTESLFPLSFLSFGATSIRLIGPVTRLSVAITRLGEASTRRGRAFFAPSACPGILFLLAQFSEEPFFMVLHRNAYLIICFICLTHLTKPVVARCTLKITSTAYFSPNRPQTWRFRTGYRAGNRAPG